MFSLSCQVSSLSSFICSSCFPAYFIIFPRRNELPLGTFNFCVPCSLAIAMIVRITTPIPQMSCGLVSPLSSFLTLLSSPLSSLFSPLLSPLSSLLSPLLSPLFSLPALLSPSPLSSLLPLLSPCSSLLFSLLALLSSFLSPLSSPLSLPSSLFPALLSPAFSNRSTGAAFSVRSARFPGRVSPVSQSGQAAGQVSPSGFPGQVSAVSRFPGRVSLVSRSTGIRFPGQVFQSTGIRFPGQVFRSTGIRVHGHPVTVSRSRSVPRPWRPSGICIYIYMIIYVYGCSQLILETGNMEEQTCVNLPKLNRKPQIIGQNA